MYGCQNWTIKKVERWRIDAFEVWYWRRLLRVPWTAKGSNQSILKEIVLNIRWEDSEAETLILWPPEAKNWFIWKDPDAGKDWRREDKGMTGWDGWMASLTQWTLVWVNPGVGDGQGGLACCSPLCPKELDTTEQLNWNPLSWPLSSSTYMGIFSINILEHFLEIFDNLKNSQMNCV